MEKGLEKGWECPALTAAAIPRNPAPPPWPCPAGRGAAPVTVLKCSGRGSSSGPGPSLPACPRRRREPCPGQPRWAQPCPQRQGCGSRCQVARFGEGYFLRKCRVVYLGKGQGRFCSACVGDALYTSASYS